MLVLLLVQQRMEQQLRPLRLTAQLWLVMVPFLPRVEAVVPAVEEDGCTCS